MSQIDTSMYQNVQAPDFMAGVTGYMQGMKLKEMARQQTLNDRSMQYDNTLKTAYQPDPNTGQLVFNPQKLSDLAAIDPQRAYGQQVQMRQDALAQQKAQLDSHQVQLGIMGQILGGVHDQDSYDSAKKDLVSYGHFGPGEIPDEYSADWVKSNQMRALSYKDQLDQTNKQIEQAQKGQEADAKTSEAASKAAEVGVRKDDLAIQRQKFEKEQYGQQLDQTQKILESARGNPAVSQAQTDLYSAKKINTLVGQYGDANQMPPAQVNLLAGEVAKMANGGAPTLEVLREIRPDTIRGSLAESAQKVMNEPTPANQGAFVKQLQAYSNGISDDARGVIKDKVGRVLDARQRTLNPVDHAKLKSGYLDPLMNPDRPATSPAAGLAAHPQDAQAVQWAKSNPTDPRSAKILQMNGAQ